VLKGEDLARLDKDLELLDLEYPRRGSGALELVAFGAQLVKTGHSVTASWSGCMRSRDALCARLSAT